MKTISLFLMFSYCTLAFSGDKVVEDFRNEGKWKIEQNFDKLGMQSECVGVNGDDRILNNGSSLLFKLVQPRRALYLQGIQLRFDDAVALPWRKASESEILAGAAILQGSELSKAISSKKLFITATFTMTMSALDRTINLEGIPRVISNVINQCANLKQQ